MDTAPQKPKVSGLILFVIGVVSGILLIVGLMWPDLEAMFYNFQKIGEQPLDVICPVFLAQDETGMVSIKVANESDKTIEPLVRATISSRGLFRFEESRLPIPPGETRRMTWAVSKADVDLRFFVLAKVFILPEYQFTSREGTCGTLLLPFSGIGGMQVFLIGLAVSLLGLAGGLWLWPAGIKPLIGRRLETLRAMQAVTLAIGIGIFFGYLGSWALAGLALIVTVLLLAAVIHLSASR